MDNNEPCEHPCLVCGLSDDRFWTLRLSVTDVEALLLVLDRQRGAALQSGAEAIAVGRAQEQLELAMHDVAALREAEAARADGR